ncbi:MAG TPA: recombinase family protein, partial [Methanomassiliicoccales archaeon]|nr:recombinase family protein [Methanomassiliicoccales archaeon]
PGQIAEALNREGVPAKNGGAWQRATIYGILANRIYLGKLVWEGIEQEAPQLKVIEPTLFEEVQGLVALRMKSRRKQRRISAKTLFRSEAHA